MNKYFWSLLIILYQIGESHQGLHSLLNKADSLIAAYPDSAELYFDRGEWYRLHGDSGKAEKDYKKTDSLKPNWNVLNYSRAKLAFDGDNYQGALNFVQTFIKNKPNDITGIILKGESLFKLGKIKEANSSFISAIKRHKRPPPHLFYQVATLYLSISDTVNALLWLDNGVKKLGNIDLLQSQQIEIYLAKGDWKKAISILDKQFRKRKNKVRYYFQLGKIYTDLNKKKMAEESFKNALESYNSIPKRISESKVYEILKDSINYYLNQ